MNVAKKILAATVLLLLSVGMRAQTNEYDVFVPIGKYLAQGNADALSAWFSDNLEVSIFSRSSTASKSQARQIVKSFFETYTPSRFSITHTAGRANMKYVLGELNAGGERFHITIFVSCKDGTYRIQQFKVDKT